MATAKQMTDELLDQGKTEGYIIGWLESLLQQAVDDPKNSQKTLDANYAALVKKRSQPKTA